MSGILLEPDIAAPRFADPDSRARTHLANERTFLAWLRTGLSLVAVGMAVAGFLPPDLIPGFRFITGFALILVVFGTTLVLYGAQRYVRANRQIETGSYQPTVTGIIAIALMVGVLGAMAIPIVYLVR
ncbi:MAG: YidH family protein [Thermomicrobiales bacterium]